MRRGLQGNGVGKQVEEQGENKRVCAKPTNTAGLHRGTEYAAHYAQVLPSPLRREREGRQVYIRGGFHISELLLVNFVEL
jgi:hypothetical protein